MDLQDKIRLADFRMSLASRNFLFILNYLLL